MNQDIAAGEIRIVDLDSRVEAEFNVLMATCYRRTPPLPIRTFDAVHLASARVSGETEIVATDKRLRHAASCWVSPSFPLERKRPLLRFAQAEPCSALRRHKPVTRHWMARRLHIGSASYVSHLVVQPSFIVDYENRSRLMGDPF